jgi:ATP-dependent DNA helicase RecG
LVESQQNIVKLIIDNPRISKREMAEQIGISSTAIDNNLTKLKDKNSSRRGGKDKTGHWEIIE